MTLQDFITKARRRDVSIPTLGKRAIAELNQRVNGHDRRRPSHLPDQRELVHTFFDTDDERWLLFLDAGRYDYFDRLVADYFEGELQRVWNGGVGYTGDWTVRTLRHDFGDRGLWSWVPMASMQAVDYTPEKWFAHVPDLQPRANVNDQLAALGYREGSTADGLDKEPQVVNDVVRADKAETNGGVVRYLKPHPPFDGLDELTAESTKTMKTRAALESGDLTDAELHDAYEDTFRHGLKAARKLVPELDGKVVITADHGTCLSCGQLFHGRRLAKHDHLTTVPWFEVTETV